MFCVFQCVLDDGGGLTSKPAVNLPSVGSQSSLPSVTLTAVSSTNLPMLLTPPPISNGSSHLLPAAFDHRLSLSTTSMSTGASSSRRMSLGTLRVSSSQQRQASSSALFVDGMSLLARPTDADVPRRSVTSGRSPRVRRKLSRATTGRGSKDKRLTKLSKVTIQSKPPVVDDWLKFDFSSVMSGVTASSVDVGATECDVSADEDGSGSVAAAASFVDAVDTVSLRVENQELYADLAQMTHSVGRFSKLAYPDMCGHVVTPFKEAFYEKRFGTQRYDRSSANEQFFDAELFYYCDVSISLRGIPRMLIFIRRCLLFLLPVLITETG